MSLEGDYDEFEVTPILELFVIHICYELGGSLMIIRYISL
jgi:hypothetical protein